MRQGNRHDHREQFRCQAHSEGEGKQKGLQRRTVKQQIDEQREKHQQDRKPQDHPPEIANAEREGGFRRRFAQRAGDPAKFRGPAGRDHQHPGGPAQDRTSHEDRISGEQGGGGRIREFLLGRIGFARQQGFVDV